MIADLIGGQFPSLLTVSFLVGIVVGLTGMGGGALMTPALIFLGIPPTTAVANDLVAEPISIILTSPDGVVTSSASPSA